MLVYCHIYIVIHIGVIVVECIADNYWELLARTSYISHDDLPVDNADAGPQRYLLSLDYKIIILHHNPN